MAGVVASGRSAGTLLRLCALMSVETDERTIDVCLRSSSVIVKHHCELHLHTQVNTPLPRFDLGSPV
eukprot:54113-Eustigmatos_ZCMA.PRE.1